MGRKTSKSKSSGGRRSRVRYDISDDAIPMNAVDEFADANERIDLKKSSKRAEDIEDEDVEVPLDNVLALSSDDDDDDMSDGNADSRRSQAIQDEADISGAWGAKKHMYYNSEATGFEAGDKKNKKKAGAEFLMEPQEEGDAYEEEVEARRMQREALDDADEDDFGEDDLDDLVKAELEKMQSKPMKDAEALKGMNDDLDDIHIDLGQEMSSSDDDEDAEEEERITSAALSRDAKLEMVVNSCPELLGVVSAVQETITSLRARVSELETSDGISLLDVQVQLLMQYCSNLLFFLLLKAEGRSVKGHPVIERLIQFRVRLEKIAPLQSKLKYQIDKLMRTATLGTVQANDPLRFKPNPSSLVQEEDDVEEHEQADANIYVAPKNRSVAFEDEIKSEKATKRESKRQLSRVKSSRMLAELKHEFSEAPEELKRQELDEEETEDKDQIERREFEEDMLMRTMVTKKEKLRKKAKDKAKKDKKGNHFEDLDDFEDVVGYLEPETKTVDRDDGKAELKKLRDAKKKAKAKKIDLDVDMFDGDAMEMFEQAKKQTSKKKAKKAENNEAKQVFYEEQHEMEEGDRRDVGKKIMQNKGLKRYRNKLDKNPRVKHRRRFEKAVQKRKGIVAEYNANAASKYDGEKTGIKANLSRSVKL